MLFQDICKFLKDHQEQANPMHGNVDDNIADALSYPHYYTYEDIINENAPKNISEIMISAKYDDFQIPHDCFNLSFRFNSNKELDQFFLCCVDHGDSLEITIYYNYINNKDFEFIKTYATSNEAGEIEFSIKEHTGQNYEIVNDYIMAYFFRFLWILYNNKKVREGKERRTFKASNRIKGKKAYRDYTLIYLDTVKNIKSGNVANKHIEWSHSWPVKGTYRSLGCSNKIGKNRKGEYCIPGKTWVIPHEKQKHLEPKNKLRILR